MGSLEVPPHEFSPDGEAGLGENVADMALHCPLGQDKSAGNVTAGQSLCDQCQHPLAREG